MKVNLIKGDKVDPNTDYRDALPVNMYSVKKDILGANGYMLCYPGLKSFATGSGKDRGGVYNERRGGLYRVSGGKLISLTGSGAAHEVGDISGTDQAAMPYSFNTQAVIADGKMWLCDGSTVTQTTGGGIGSPIDGVWIDGYYFLTDGEYLYHTELTDESSINALSYATAEFMPDPSLGLGKTQDNKVIVFGRYTMEYFVNVATQYFAFKRIETRAQKIGIVATHAKCELGGKWYIVGGRKEESVSVHAIGLGDSEKIASREIDKIISKYSEVELRDIRVEGRTEDGTSFILVHLPYETLLFNLNIAQAFGIDYAWSLLKSGKYENVPHRAINGVFDPRNSKWIFGDRQGAQIGEIDNTSFAQYGEDSEWYIFPPFVKLETLSIDQIAMETIPGHTALLDAKVAISCTFNGLTYGKEWWMNYGQPTEYSQRFIVRRLGYVPDWIGFRFRGLTKSRMSFANFEIMAS